MIQLSFVIYIRTNVDVMKTKIERVSCALLKIASSPLTSMLTFLATYLFLHNLAVRCYRKAGRNEPINNPDIILKKRNTQSSYLLQLSE